MTAEETYATCCIIIPHQTCLRTQKFHEKQVSSPDESRRESTFNCFHLALTIQLVATKALLRRSLWPRGLGRGSGAASLLGLHVRIPRGIWLSLESVVCCQREVSLGRPDESLSDFVTSTMSRPRPTKAVFFFSAANEKQSLDQENSPHINTATVGSLVTKLCSM